jgi:hypothetical protein
MIYLVGADDELTLEVTATPTTPPVFYCCWKILDTIFRRVVDGDRKIGSLANTTPVVLMEMGVLENKRLLLETLQITNKDNVARTFLLKVTDGTNTAEPFRVEVPAGGQFLLSGNGDAIVRTATGALDVP